MTSDSEALPRPLTPPLTLAVFAVGTAVVLFLPFNVPAALNLSFGLWFSEIFLFFAVAWELLRLSGRNPAAYTGLRHVSPQAIGVGALLGLLNVAAVILPLQILTKTYLEPFVPPWLKQDASLLFEGALPVELAVIVGAVSLAAPLAEELFFRGLVQNALAERERPVRALLITSVLFSAFHLDAVGFLGRVELGALFGLLFWTSRSIWPGIAAHAANNSVVSVLFIVGRAKGGGDSWQPPPLPVIAGGILGGLAMAGVWRLLLPVLRRHVAPPVDVVLIARPKSLWPAILRWGGAATLSLVLLLAVDYRGVVLNLLDVRYSLPRGSNVRGSSRIPPALRQLRLDVRRGKAPLAQYQEARRHLSEFLRATPQGAPAVPPPHG